MKFIKITKILYSVFKSLFGIYFANFKRVNHRITSEMRMIGNSQKNLEKIKKNKVEKIEEIKQPMSAKKNKVEDIKSSLKRMSIGIEEIPETNELE